MGFKRSMSENPLSLVEPWDLVASGYDEMSPWIMAPFSERAMELVPLSPEAQAVDVASGTGVLTLRLASKVKSVHALDFSKNMVARLENTLKEKASGSL